MFNDYMLPYEAAVEAGVGSVMASFNEVDGIPATANKWLMTDILRGQWGFNGFVVTDYTGISEMIDHGIGDLQTVSARAINAGVDMDMVSEGFVGTLKKSVQEGKVSMETLNTACRRILEANINWDCLIILINIAIRNVRHATSLPKPIVMQPARLQQKVSFF